MQTQAKKVGRKFRDGDHRRIVQRHAVVCLASFAVSHEDDSRSPALQSKRASKNNTTCIISVGCIISGTRQSRWDTAAHTSATRRHPGGTPAATRRQQRRRAVDALRERRRSAQNGASSAGTSIVSQAKAAARAGPVAASPRVRAAASNRHCRGPTPLASGESSAHLRPQHAAAPGAWPRAATWDRIEVCPESKKRHHARSAESRKRSVAFPRVRCRSMRTRERTRWRTRRRIKSSA